MTANQTVGAAPSPREIPLGPGAIFPDWSAVVSDKARAVVDAFIDLAGLEDRWRGIGEAEDTVRRAVLRRYAETGRAPSIAELGDVTGLGSDAARGLLKQLKERDLVVLDDAGGAILGAYPFTERDTGHRVDLGGTTVSAMCAIDALGVGAMCERDAAIGSTCRACGEAIEIATRARGAALDRVAPEGAVVWVGLRYAGACAASSLCTVMTFFCSDAHLDRWRGANYPDLDGIRLSIDEATQAGKAIFTPMLAGT